MPTALATPNGLSLMRSRLQLLLLLGIVIGPMLIAAAMYHFKVGVPQNRTYHGELLGDGTHRQALGVASGETRWQLLVTAPSACTQDCQQLVHQARQINIALNREALRVSHALASTEPLEQAYEERLAREYPQLKRYALDRPTYQNLSQNLAPSLWIIDPQGHVVLRYKATDNGRDVLKDLLLLLKLSRLG